MTMILPLLMLVTTATAASPCETQGARAARLVRVIDGDTVDVVINLGFDVSINRRVRLDGIDTPELHSTDAAERASAKKAQSRLAELLRQPDFCVSLKYKLDKYGRALVVLFRARTTRTINETLVSEGHARLYDGGKRPPW